MSELDPSILARAREGDARAFRVLYEHHGDMVYAFLLRMLRERAAAEDAVQEVFMRVLRSLGRFRPAGPARLSTWILAIARNVAIDGLRRAPLPEPPPPAPGAPRDDLRLTLEGAVAALPDAQRAVFLLYECGDRTYEEIAEIEGLDVGTVKSRLHRARAALQETLRDERPSAADRDPEGGTRACK